MFTPLRGPFGLRVLDSVETLVDSLDVTGSPRSASSLRAQRIGKKSLVLGIQHRLRYLSPTRDPVANGYRERAALGMPTERGRSRVPEDAVCSDFAVKLSEITIVIEWENPRDVEFFWTDRAMRALADELARMGANASDKPTVLYLFDEEVLDEASVRDSIARSAPDLSELASLRSIPTPGLSYYQLKNLGVALAETPYVVLLDSDVCPQPGWLSGLLRPFVDDHIVAVSGVTSLESRDLLSRTMALIWIFDLPSEHEQSRGAANLHANNSAFRTHFFQQNPFPDTLAFKKQCGVWLTAILERGFGFERIPEAYCRHAPHSGLRFILWRGIQSGFDRDVKIALEGKGRLVRLLIAGGVWAKKTSRSTRRILFYRREVNMPFYEVPASLGVAWLYSFALASAQATSAIFDGVPNSFRRRWSESGRS
jgi:hypothetical protein